MSSSEKSIPMASKSTIQYLNLSPADNGVVMSWSEKQEKSASKGTYDNCNYVDKKEVFMAAPGASDAKASAFEAAMPRFKELWLQQYS